MQKVSSKVSSKLSENSEKYQVNQTEKFSHVKDYYFVDRSGNVYSNRSGEMKKLNQHKERGGYMKVKLMSKTNKMVNCKVHQIVCHAFNDGYSESMSQTHHINSIRHDNRAENLQFVTQLTNAQHANGMTVHAICKYTGLRYKFLSINSASKYFNISANQLRKVKSDELFLNNYYIFIEEIGYEGIQEFMAIVKQKQVTTIGKDDVICVM